jgi:hypothetical protein
MNTKAKKITTNIFGTLGYISILIQWLWVMLAYGPAMLNTQFFQDQLMPKPAPEKPIQPITPQDDSSWIMAGLAVLITVLVLLLVIFIVLKAPIAIAKTGKNITHKTTDKIVPLVTHKKELKARERRRLTMRILISIKLIGAVLSFLIILPAQLIDSLEIDFAILLFVASVSAGFTVVAFVAQHLLARYFKLNSKDVW